MSDYTVTLGVLISLARGMLFRLVFHDDVRVRTLIVLISLARVTDSGSGAGMTLFESSFPKSYKWIR